LHEAYQLKKGEEENPQKNSKRVLFSKRKRLPRPALHCMLNKNSLEMMNPFLAWSHDGKMESIVKAA
jgi:hypothetical protein